MSDTHNVLQYGNMLNQGKILDLILDFNYFSFSNCNINPNPTHLPKHQILSPNHQFSQRILYVECCSVHAHMAWSQKFRLTLVIQPPTLLQNVLFCLFLLTSVVQNVCACMLWTSCLWAKIHYYHYMWPFARKVYHGWISTMTSSNEILWKLPTPPKWRAACAPAQCFVSVWWPDLRSTSRKVARRPWAPRIVLEFVIKTHYVLDSWKTSCCPWILSGVLENSWMFLK